MRRILLFLFICSLLCVPHKAAAHLAGQPPFFLINNEYAGYYPIYVTSLPDLTLPQDTAPTNYLINTPITFEIDRQMLPFPDPIIDKTTFTWDFGDGTTGTGLTNTHRYTEAGSFVLKITADYGEYSDANTKPLLQAVLLNILPDKDYKLPKAIIRINKTVITNPTKDIISLSLDESLLLDGSLSKSGSSPIVSYFWDVGDGTKRDDRSFNYTYADPNLTYIFPFLRVKDTRGFISDAYLQIERTAGKSSKAMSFLGREISPIILLVILINGGILVTIFYLLRRK